ncbi:MAG: mechanosensitive ion channel family protein [Treponema sp.]|jgi:small-conductance mechanosensitive channel|nr:mechanosensitive ion channel family protein [Treponema sp.]
MKRIGFFVLAVFLLLPLPFALAQEVVSGEAETTEPVEPAEATEPQAAVDEPVVITDVEKDIEAIEDITTAETHTMGFFTRLGIALAIIAGQVLLIWLIWLLFSFLSKKIVNLSGDKIKPFTIKKLKLLSEKQIINAIQFVLRILKYLITAFQLFLTLPIVFRLFPATRNLSTTLFGYILTPLKNIAIGTIKYIPNLFTIVIIILVTHYVLKALKFLSLQITKGKLVIPGFYADWAAPTYKILQVLLWAFTVALVYPYLPGSDSGAFKGVSIFVGIVFSLGSSTAIGNLVAGLVITYMRPFKIGDRVKINESTGFVMGKTLMVVRLKTHKNEYVTFPNLTILNSAIINYNTSSDEDEEGLILNTEITYGYATPWETVHELLINAALATNHVQKRPKPFVLQTSLDDFYARYQINCYTKEVEKIPQIYAQLYENIQKAFREAGIDLTSPHYEVARVES